MAKIKTQYVRQRVCWDLFQDDAHQYGAHACWVKQSEKQLEFLCRSFCCLWAAQQSSGFSWGSYLRISCREEVISLPTYRLTGRGQSHLQCRSREAGRRGRRRRRKGWKGGGEGTGEESIALHSLAPPLAQISRKYNAHHYGIKRCRQWKPKKKNLSITKWQDLPLPQGLFYLLISYM